MTRGSERIFGVGLDKSIRASVITGVVGAVGVPGVEESVCETEDIFLGEVWGGGLVGLKSAEMDVALYQFSYERSGVKCVLKE